VHPTDGTVLVAGEPMTSHTPEAYARAGVGRTFQNLRLMDELTVFDNVALGVNRRLPTVLGVPIGSRRRIRTDVAAAVADVGLDVPLWRPVVSLSYGQRKRVELARLLVGRARLLLLDEPTAGVSRVDPPAMAAMLRGLAGGDRALAFVEHDLDLVGAVADRVVCVDAGRVVADGPFDDVLNDSVVRAAVLGGRQRR
jgi:ABC-type branched-subunit amino acid transport system ATPase component